MTAIENWHADLNRQHSVVVGNTDGFKEFNRSTIKGFLSGTTENQCYSPVNLYIALAMLTEVTEGQSRTELLRALGYESVEQVRNLCKAIWEVTYMNDGSNFSIPAASIWLNDSVDYNRDILQTLADNYYASSFAGEMGSEEYSEGLRNWINYQTGNLLEEQSADLSLDPDTVLAIATTNYFREKWSSPFSEYANVTDVFYSPDGERGCEYMTKQWTDVYYYGEQFGAVEIDFENALGSMWFILPDEGVTCDELLENDEAMDFIITGNSSWEKKTVIKVNKMIPKFDISSRLSLREKLKDMGVNSVFFPEPSVPFCH